MTDLDELEDYRNRVRHFLLQQGEKYGLLEPREVLQMVAKVDPQHGIKVSFASFGRQELSESFDSLDSMSLILELEETFDIVLPDFPPTVVTFGDLVEWIVTIIVTTK